jgi:very-short-patch-repair endonuclease
MKVSEHTIKRLGRIACGDSQFMPYKSGPELVKLFNQFGFNDIYESGFPSRWQYTENNLRKINGKPEFKELIENIVDPREFQNTQLNFEAAVLHINEIIKFDGFKIINEGLFPKIINTKKNFGVDGKVKNIIFASTGPKPEIIISDSLNNNIEIVKNSEYCLIYDLEITDNGLLWTDLINWWIKKNGFSISYNEVQNNLYLRLFKSINSEPEKLFFKAYFERFKTLEKNLPALIPQVYLHYDPKTFKELKGLKRLQHQRMDFLLLLSNNIRIVIEIDGKQHYSDNDIASPKKYSEMVNSDRELKLNGYELFCFGAYELYKEKGKIIVEKFFNRLFEKYEINKINV